jgi:hypothetical protein
VRVLDRGPTPTVPALPADPPSPMALGGRGLWLIRQLADEVRVEPSGGGTLLAMRRRAWAAGSWAGGGTGRPGAHDYGRLDQAQNGRSMDGRGQRVGDWGRGRGANDDARHTARDQRPFAGGDDFGGGDDRRVEWRGIRNPGKRRQTRAAG